MNNEIIIYHADEITKLFSRDIKTIGKHINNIYSEGELSKDSTVAFFATVQTEGDRSVSRNIEYYNLDVIISVGYRVKSKQGTQFRIWANKVLKDYLLKGYSLNNRMTLIEDNIEGLSKQINKIDLQVNTNRPLTQGVFFEGQIFDAHVFISSLIKDATSSIILIDNYVDECTIQLFKKKNEQMSM